MLTISARLPPPAVIQPQVLVGRPRAMPGTPAMTAPSPPSPCRNRSRRDRDWWDDAGRPVSGSSTMHQRHRHSRRARRSPAPQCRRQASRSARRGRYLDVPAGRPVMVGSDHADLAHLAHRQDSASNPPPSPRRRSSQNVHLCPLLWFQSVVRSGSRSSNPEIRYHLFGHLHRLPVVDDHSQMLLTRSAVRSGCAAHNRCVA